MVMASAALPSATAKLEGVLQETHALALRFSASQLRPNAFHQLQVMDKCICLHGGVLPAWWCPA